MTCTATQTDDLPAWAPQAIANGAYNVPADLVADTLVELRDGRLAVVVERLHDEVGCYGVKARFLWKGEFLANPITLNAWKLEGAEYDA